MRRAQALALLMPAGTVTDQDSMSKLAPKADEGADKDYRDTYEELTGLSLLLPAGNRRDYLPHRTMSRRAVTRFIIKCEGQGGRT